MTQRPDLRELIGDDVPAEELARLERVHELLIAAGPPPELSPELEHAAPPRRRIVERRRFGVLGLAAGLVAVAFVAGTFYGRSQADLDVEFSVQMRGNERAGSALGTLEVGERDQSGNWPMILKVRGLERLTSPKGYYQLLLTRKGKRSLPCGNFIVREGTTTAYLNAPYALNRESTWVVAVHPRGHIENPPIVMTTVT